MDEWNDDYTNSLISFQDFHDMCDQLDKMAIDNGFEYYDQLEEYQQFGDFDEQ